MRKINIAHFISYVNVRQPLSGHVMGIDGGVTVSILTGKTRDMTSRN